MRLVLAVMASDNNPDREVIPMYYSKPGELKPYENPINTISPDAKEWSRVVEHEENLLRHILSALAELDTMCTITGHNQAMTGFLFYEGVLVRQLLTGAMTILTRHLAIANKNAKTT